MGDVPIQSGDAVVDDTKYLNTFSAAGSAASTTVASGGKYYDTDPITAWPNCAGGGTYAPSDIVKVASDIMGSPFIFFDVTQGATNMCTSIACAQAFALKYVLGQAGRFPAGLGMTGVPQLSAVYAYYFQRAQECQVFGVCKCGTCVPPMCPDPCDPPCTDCGSFLRSATTVFVKGVANAQTWPYTMPMNLLPSSAARLNALAFRVTAWRCVAGTAAAFATQLSAFNPVVVILYLGPQHVQWMSAQRVGSSFSLPVLPPPVSNPAASNVVGHAVLLTAFTGTAFVARNNFGTAWGAGGFFAIQARDVTPTLIHSAVAFTAVCGPAPVDVQAATPPRSTC